MARITGTPAVRDNRRPVCPFGHTDILKIHGDWFCVECKPVQIKSQESVSLRAIFPNRAARRAARAT